MSVANKIEANDRSLREILQSTKYQIDFFQREYKWERKHIEQLLIDLEEAFSENYSLGHTINDVSKYNSYYMGPVIFYNKGGTKSIIDGQQRLTSITLLLFHINQIQENRIDAEPILELIYSRKYGRESFNLDIEERKDIYESFLNGIEYSLMGIINPTILNLYDRYEDVKELFPEDLSEFKLPLFIEWLKEKLVFVEIIAYSDKNAYTIFETMNDRGYNITPSEMLKGLLLSKIHDEDSLHELNKIWRNKISRLHSHSIDEDLEFFRAWFRGQFAESMKTSSKAGTEREDFEKIGTSFHRWVKENSKKLKLRTEEDYYYFVKGDFVFYSDLYLRIKKFEKYPHPGLELINHLTNFSIATSLSYPLYISAINKTDSEDIIIEKLKIISRFIERYVVLRSINRQPISQTSIRYSIFNSVIRKLRRLSTDELDTYLNEYLDTSLNNFDKFSSITTSNSNDKFIKYLLAKIIIHLSKQIGVDVDFYDLVSARRKSGCKLMHLLNNDIRDNFSTEDEFLKAVLSIGAVSLIRKDYLDRDVSELNILNRIYSVDNLEDEARSILEKQYDLPEIKNINLESVEERIQFLKQVTQEIWG